MISLISQEKGSPLGSCCPCKGQYSGKYKIAVVLVPQDTSGIKPPPTLVVFWVRVQEEAHESGIIEVVSIDPIFVPIPIHLKPDLIPRAEVQQDRAAGLVDIVVLELVIGEDHGLVFPVEADLDV